MREGREKCKTWVSVDLKILNYCITSQHPNTSPMPQCTLVLVLSNSGPRNKIRKTLKRNCCWDEFVSSVTEVGCIIPLLHLSTTILKTLSRNENIWQARCGGGGTAVTVAKQPLASRESTALLFNFPVYKCLEIVNVARKLNSVMQSVMTNYNYYMFSKVQNSRIIQKGRLYTTHNLVWVKSWHKMNKC